MAPCEPDCSAAASDVVTGCPAGRGNEHRSAGPIWMRDAACTPCRRAPRSRLPSKSNRRVLRPFRDKHFRCQPLCQTVMSMLSAPRRDRGVPARAAVRQPSRLFSHDDSRRGALGRSDGGRGRGTHWAGESRPHDVRVRHIPRFRDDRNCRYRVRLPERPDVTSRRTRDVVASIARRRSNSDARSHWRNVRSSKSASSSGPIVATSVTYSATVWAGRADTGVVVRSCGSR